MSSSPTRGRGRIAVVAAVAGALVAGASSAPTALGAPTRDARPEVLATFAKQARERSGAPEPRSPREDARAVKGGSKTPQAPSRDGGASRTTQQQTAAAGDCADLGLVLTQTSEHNHVSWASLPGATGFSVTRERPGAAAVTVASALVGTRTSFRDTTQNTLGLAAYNVRATVDGSTFSCRIPETDYVSMSTPDGVGYPDLFFAGGTQVWEQDTYGPAFPSYTADASRPAFSPNGRLVAAVEQVSGTWSITVRKASTGQLLWSVGSPTGTMLDEPSFSPDGQRIVAEALSLPDLLSSEGLYTVPVNTATHPLTLVPSSSGLVTADWIDTPGALASTTIVAADLSPGGLLTLVNAASGARTPVAGTAGALDPMGQPDGSVLFVTVDGSSSTLARRAANGGLATLQSYTDTLVRWPVAAADGNVYLYDQQPDPDNGPDAYTWSVDYYDGTVTNPSVVGQTRGLATGGFYGFDMRTPVSAGTSNFGGSANGDILARSSTGVLYAYPLSAAVDRYFDARRQMGTGWGVMKQFIAVGDLNADAQGDIVAIDTSGNLWLYPGKGSFGLGARTKIGSGWTSYAIFSTGDFNGDTVADLIARDSGGRLWLYPGTGRGGLSTRVQIGSGWSVFNAILGPGDWNYDGKTDLLARERSTGYLYLYPGKGDGGFAARTYLGSGWNGRTGFATPENYFGYTALFARTTTGVLLDYDSVGNGVMRGDSVYVAGTGWNGYTITG